jgi:hypothetical protein
VDAAITGALIGVGGVVLGVVLTAAVEARGRRHVNEEQREQARHARELIAAEHLDEALIRASAALDRDSKRPLEERYADARAAWEEGWVAFSPRIRQPKLLARYETIGSLLLEVVTGDRTTKELPRHVIARAIANARSTLGHFMRGDELPASTFPGAGGAATLARRGGQRRRRPGRPHRSAQEVADGAPHARVSRRRALVADSLRTLRSVPAAVAFNGGGDRMH